MSCNKNKTSWEAKKATNGKHIAQYALNAQLLNITMSKYDQFPFVGFSYKADIESNSLLTKFCWLPWDCIHFSQQCFNPFTTYKTLPIVSSFKMLRDETQETAFQHLCLGSGPSTWQLQAQPRWPCKSAFISMWGGIAQQGVYPFSMQTFLSIMLDTSTKWTPGVHYEARFFARRLHDSGMLLK